MDSWTRLTRDALENTEVLEASVVDLVLAVSELTEDEMELGDQLDTLLDSGRVRLQRVL
ncbi:MAG: hypothetical protein ACQGVK_19180 [Myxococcota bacterium]